MAHLSNDALPSDFDVVVEGTGVLHTTYAYEVLYGLVRYLNTVASISLDH